MNLMDRLKAVVAKGAEQQKAAMGYAEALRVSGDDVAMRQVRELAAAGDEEAKGLLADIESALKDAEGSKPAQAVKAALALMTRVANEDRVRLSAVIREGIETGALRECSPGETPNVSVYDLDLGRVVRVTGALNLSETNSLVERLREAVRDQREKLVEALKAGDVHFQLAAEVAVELRMGKVLSWTEIEAKKAEATKAEAADGKKHGVPPYFRFTYRVTLDGGKLEPRDSAIIPWGKGRDASYPNEKSFEFVSFLHAEAKRQQELLRERLPEFTLDEAEAVESGSFTEIIAGAVGEAVLKLEVAWKYADDRESPIFVKVARAIATESVKVVKAWPVEAARSLFRRPDGQLKTTHVVYKFVRDESNRVTELSFEEVRDNRLRATFQRRVASEANMSVVSAAQAKRDEADRAERLKFREEIQAEGTISREEYLAGKPGLLAVCNDHWKLGRSEQEIDLVDGLLKSDGQNVVPIKLSNATRKLVFEGGMPIEPRNRFQLPGRVHAWIMTSGSGPVVKSVGGGESPAAKTSADAGRKPAKVTTINEAFEKATAGLPPRGKSKKQMERERGGGGRNRGGIEPQDELEGY